MAVVEKNALMKYKDTSGNTTLLYPITVKDNVDGLNELVRDQSITTTGNGAAYLAAVEGFTSLSAGVSFVMVPHVASTSSTATLNVNSLGAKVIRRRVSSNSGETSVGHSNNWLAAGKPVRVTYDGTYWIADLPKPSASDLVGSVAIANGGTGATTPSAARTNIGAIGATSRSITLNAASWASNSQTVTVSGVSTSNIVIVSPSPDSFEAYGEAGVRCSAQANNSLTFTCSDTPSANLTVNVIILE